MSIAANAHSKHVASEPAEGEDTVAKETLKKPSKSGEIRLPHELNG
ncbi:MAG: hypothetical protein ACOH2T_28035 [Pseudomonas sp.]